MIKRKDKIDSFKAISLSGSIFTIEVFQNILDVGSMGNPNAEKGGLKEALTYPDGVHCTRIDDNTFQIFNGEIVTRILK